MNLMIQSNKIIQKSKLNATHLPASKTSEPIINQQNKKPAILEVFTHTLDNDRILLQYFKELV